MWQIEDTVRSLFTWQGCEVPSHVMRIVVCGNPGDALKSAEKIRMKTTRFEVAELLKDMSANNGARGFDERFAQQSVHLGLPQAA